jgi:ATP-independent RNA helicase DbpA
VTAFSTLNVLPAAQLDNLNELGYLTMTPVQAAALPAILEGRTCACRRKRAVGKTAAFGLGLLQHIDAALFRPSLWCCVRPASWPIRLLGELRRLARFLPNTKILTLCGGQPFGAQRDSLQHAPHIIVATPGRLLDHLQKGSLAGCVTNAGDG